MFFPEQQVRVFLYGAPVDMRRSFDGLYAIARHGMPVDPLAGHLFAFINRRADQATFSIPIEICHNGISMASIARPATSGGSS